MGPPIRRVHADAHVSMSETERYVSDAQTRWPVVLRQACLGHADPAFTLRLYATLCGSAEAAAADIFAQAMKTPSTEPLAKGRSELEPKDEISSSGWRGLHVSA